MPSRTAFEPPDRIIVLRLGVRPAQRWREVIEAKMTEEKAFSIAQWCYGGHLCDPLLEVQPFARASRGPVSVLFIGTEGDWDPPTALATLRSADGKTWLPIPDGVLAAGRNALVLRDFRSSDEWFDLPSFEVGAGPNTGVPLTKYFRGRVDKACARRTAEPKEPVHLVQLVARAQLAPPFAALLRVG